MWLLTVASVTKSRAAISVFESPRRSGEHLGLARRQPVGSVARRLGSAPARVGDGLDEVVLDGGIDRRLAADDGLRSRCSISSAPASLVRKPRAPARSARPRSGRRHRS